MLVMLIAPNFFTKKEGPQVDSELAVTSLLATHTSNFCIDTLHAYTLL